MQFDAIVVGGSFAGLSAAMQIARGRRRVAVIDAGKPRNRFAAHSHGFFGQDGVAPLTLIAQGRDKLRAYPKVQLIEGEAVTIDGQDGAFAVALSSGATLSAAKLVLASGIVDELPLLPGLAERWGSTVLHCPYCHGYEFDGGPLGVLAANPMSAHHATVISEWGPTTLFMNGRTDLDAEALERLRARGIAIEPAALTRMHTREAGMELLELADGRALAVRALYVQTRTRMASPLAERLGCAFDDGPFGPVIRTDAGKLTTVAGVYAAGDMARAPHNATWASADGVTAGASLHQALIFGSH